MDELEPLRIIQRLSYCFENDFEDALVEHHFIHIPKSPSWLAILLLK